MVFEARFGSVHVKFWLTPRDTLRLAESLENAVDAGFGEVLPDDKSDGNNSGSAHVS